MEWHVGFRVLPMMMVALLAWGCGDSEPERSAPQPETSQELKSIADSLEARLAEDEDEGTTRSEDTEEEFFFPGQDLVARANATPTPEPTPETTEVELEFDRSPLAPESLPEWSYEGENGPDFWGTLGESCATCGEGRAQSPIDLTGAVEADLPNPVFDYGKSKIHIVNTGHTLQVNVEPGNLMELDGEYYELTQFHMHAPSEHAIDGRKFQAEMHFVHRGVDGSVAVVAVMIKKGTKNAAYAEVMQLLPAEKDLEIDIEDPAEIGALLPKGRTAYRYEGSLTTPPCTEGVKWVVLTEPVGLSIAQLEPFLEILEGNHRPLQPLNSRTIQVDVTP